MKKKQISAGKFEKNAEIPKNQKIVLKLFIAGNTPNSLKAVENTKSFCEKYLQGRYALDVIDIYQQPLLLMEEQVVAVPMLIKKLPKPIRKMIGNASNIEKVLVSLNIK